MQKLKPTALSKILEKQDLRHNSVISKAARLIKLNKLLHNFLPKPMGDFCRISSIKGVIVTLYARTPAWCYKLRLHASEISKYLNQNGISTKKVRIVVIPSSPETVTKTLPTPTISDHARQSIKETAMSMEDSELKDTLLSIAENTSSPDIKKRNQKP